MAEKAPQKVEDIPDPDEDELDDLDDVLDEFQATSISQEAKATSTTPTASGPGRPVDSKDAPLPDPSEQDMAAQLQAGMSSLISELDSNPQMQAEFEKMMQELIAAGAAPSDQAAGEHLKTAAEAVSQPSDASKAKAAAAGGTKKGPDDFQDTIRRTMERMQASGDAATAASTSKAEQSEEDLLAQMMKELTEGDGEGDFNSMLMNMMAHLTNKDILYDPMKELHDKFPQWLEKNKGQVSDDDYKRYEKQAKLVEQIVKRFEKKGYSDDNEEDREYIVDKMQKMQSEGSPPSDLVGDMNAAQEALGDLDSGCPSQ